VVLKVKSREAKESYRRKLGKETPVEQHERGLEQREEHNRHQVVWQQRK